jgi:hypothetical protein
MNDTHQKAPFILPETVAGVQLSHASGVLKIDHSHNESNYIDDVQIFCIKS